MSTERVFSSSETSHTEDQINATVTNWGTAFQSPEFMSGLQTAIAQSLRQLNVPTHPTATPIDVPQQPAVPSHQSNSGSSGDATAIRRQTQGTFHAPSFVVTTGGAALSHSLSAAFTSADPHQDGRETITGGSTLNSNNGSFQSDH